MPENNVFQEENGMKDFKTRNLKKKGRIRTRVLSAVTCTALLFSAAVLPVSAAGFSDVDSDEKVAWAKSSIDKMTDAGYIKGYEDGTFRPQKSISKIECLILMSRMLGYEDKKFADVASAAKDAYKTTAAKYNSTYSGELSYLLYTGVLKEDDLVDYASSANANVQLLRYQAAMLMAKLMGSDSDAKAYSVSAPSYADDASIPSAAKSYVEYVSANNIMNGMDKTADGKAQFSPMTTLTRAQMATLLARMMDKLNTSYISGTVEKSSSASITVDGSKIGISKDTVVYADGKTSDASSLSEGYTLSALVANGKAYVITASEPQEETTVYGVVVRKNENGDGQKLTIADYENEDNTATYTLRDDCAVYVNGSKGSFGSIAAKDFIKLVLSGSKVKTIETADKNIDIKGKLVSTEYDDNDNVYVNIANDETGKTEQYTVSRKGASVTRDGDDAEFSDLAAGDTVSVRLVYGKVTSVTATGKTESFTGLLKEIIISNNPAVTVTIDGKDYTYKISAKAKIYISDKESTIYDLRPNVTVSGKLDSNAVKSLSTSTVPLNEKGELTGTATGKNTTYKVITVKDEAGNTYSVYYNNSTKFFTSNGTTASVKSISEGTSLSITGGSKNGVFEATIIIIK